SDLMHRNLDRRVEVLVRVPSESHVGQLAGLLDLLTSDETMSWHLGPDGTWTRVDGVDAQEVLIERARSRRSRAWGAPCRPRPSPQRAASSGARAPPVQAWRSCWCTDPATTTGAFPRASPSGTSHCR